MHELSVAVALVELATEKLAALGAVRVEALHLRLGPLSGVVKDALLFSFDLAAEGTPLAGARLEVQEVPLIVRCPQCGDQELLTLQSLRCPLCDALTPTIVQGRELELAALEVCDDATANR